MDGGIYSKPLGINRSISLPDHCDIFQAKVSTIKAALRKIGNMHIPTADIMILSESQAAVRAHGSEYLTTEWYTGAEDVWINGSAFELYFGQLEGG